MADVSVGPRVARRSPIEIVIDRVWRFFCSVRAAVYEIIVLAVLVLIGTLRGSDAPQWLANAIPATQPLVDRWYAWDVFSSLPFMAILTILSVAIAICTINRAPSIWRTIAHPTVTTTRGFLNGADTSAKFAASTDVAGLTAQITDVMRTRRYRVLTEQRGDEIHVYGDKNRYANLGTFPFHLALILILIGGIVGGHYGFREMEFIVPEGSVREVGRGTGLSVGLERFTDTYSERAIPIDFRSEIVIYKNGEPVKEGSISVNNPMAYDGVTFYQADFGQAVELYVTDAAGTVLFADSTDIGILVSTDNPDAPAGIVDLPQVDTRLIIIGPDLDPANEPERDLLQLRSGQMFVQARPLDAEAIGEMPSAVVTQGQTVQLGDLNVQFVRERRFTLLQVARNPGIPIFFAASFLLVAGLAITFYFPHRRIRGIVGPRPDGSEAQFAPLAKRDWSGQRDFHRFVEDSSHRLGLTPTLKLPPSAADAYPDTAATPHPRPEDGQEGGSSGQSG